MYQMCCLVLVLILIIIACLINKKENLQDNIRNINQTNGSDGITTGFEDKSQNQLQMLKDTFEKQIKPTLQHFLNEYDHNIELQQQIRLKRKGEQLLESEKNILKNYLKRVTQFSSSKLYENVNPPSDETSYTSNKEYIYMCLRNREGNNHSNDILIFAFIHELAHVGCDEQGHTDAFWVYFRVLLELLCKYKAPGVPELKVKYCKVNLRNQPYHSYCQKTFTVRYNPLYDNSAYM